MNNWPRSEVSRVTALCSFFSHCPTKLGDRYQSGRGILSDTRRPMLYYVMDFVQWTRTEINQWDIICSPTGPEPSLNARGVFHFDFPDFASVSHTVGRVWQITVKFKAKSLLGRESPIKLEKKKKKKKRKLSEKVQNLETTNKLTNLIHIRRCLCAPSLLNLIQPSIPNW